MSAPGQCPVHDESAYSRDCKTNTPPEPVQAIPLVETAAGYRLRSEVVPIRETHEIQLPCHHPFALPDDQSDWRKLFTIRVECHCGVSYVVARVPTGLEVQRINTEDERVNVNGRG